VNPSEHVLPPSRSTTPSCPFPCPSSPLLQASSGDGASCYCWRRPGLPWLGCLELGTFFLHVPGSRQPSNLLLPPSSSLCRTWRWRRLREGKDAQGPALDGVVYVKAKTLSSVSMVSATTAGLEAATSTRRKGCAGPVLDGVVYVKGRKPSSVGMVGATTVGLEADGGGGSGDQRRLVWCRCQASFAVTAP
jgi:hypothetical protein